RSRSPTTTMTMALASYLSCLRRSCCTMRLTRRWRVGQRWRLLVAGAGTGRDGSSVTLSRRMDLWLQQADDPTLSAGNAQLTVVTPQPPERNSGLVPSIYRAGSSAAC